MADQNTVDERMTDVEYKLGSDQEPSIVVVTAVADVLNVDPLALEPLHTTIDTEALDEIIEGADGTDATVRFDYCGYEVAVTSTEVSVTDFE